VGDETESDCTDEEEDELSAVMKLIADDGTVNGHNADDVEALLSQGVKPWDEDADDVISTLNGEYAGVYDDYDDDDGYPEEYAGFPGFEEDDGFSDSDEDVKDDY